MKKLVLLTLLIATNVYATDITHVKKDTSNIKVQKSRAKVENVSLHITDKRTGLNEVVNLDLCTDSSYKGVSGILWGESVAVARKQKCALSVADCKAFDMLWSGSMIPDSPRKPTYMLLFDKGNMESAISDKAYNVTKNAVGTNSDDGETSPSPTPIESGSYGGMTIVTFTDGSTFASTCGNNIHP